MAWSGFVLPGTVTFRVTILVISSGPLIGVLNWAVGSGNGSMVTEKLKLPPSELISKLVSWLAWVKLGAIIPILTVAFAPGARVPLVRVYFKRVELAPGCRFQVNELEPLLIIVMV